MWVWEGVDEGKKWKKVTVTPLSLTVPHACGTVEDKGDIIRPVVCWSGSEGREREGHVR